MYSTPSCQNCILAKRFLEKNDIAFEEVNVEKDQVSAALIMARTSQQTVPVIEVGEKWIAGFREQELKRALKI